MEKQRDSLSKSAVTLIGIVIRSEYNHRFVSRENRTSLVKDFSGHALNLSIQEQKNENN